MSKEVRGYIGSAIIIVSIIVLLFFLAFVVIPETNNDVFKVILGVLLAQLPKAVSTFVGHEDDKYEKLKKEYDEIKEENDKLRVEIETLKKQLAELNDRIVNKISALSDEPKK